MDNTTVIMTEAAESPAQPAERTYHAASWTVSDGDLHITADDGSPVATYQRHCWYAVRRADATA